jgi:ADP-heptose:LPS heptosyltransferase
MKIIAFFHNGIGNFIIYTSVLQALAHHAGQSIDLGLDENWEGKEAIRQIAERCPFIDKVVDYPSQYDESKYDHVYMTAHSVFEDPMYVQIHGVKPDPDKYVSWAYSFLSEEDYYYLELIKEFDYKGPLFKQYCPTKKINIGIPTDTIALCNSWLRSPTNIMEKKEFTRWEELLETINGLYDVTFAFIGGKEDQDWAYGLQDRFTNSLNFTGETTIPETAYVIKKSKFIITVDTGCMHIADALEKPGIAIFGSTLVSKNGPINNQLKTIRSPLACAPCQNTIIERYCDHSKRCMDAIPTSYIMGAIRRVWNERN